MRMRRQEDGCNRLLHVSQNSRPQQQGIHFLPNFSAKLKRSEAAIEEQRAQIDTRKAENYGFASMAAVPYSHIVAKMLANKHPKGTDIGLAPNPKDIVRPYPCQVSTVLVDLICYRFGRI